MPSSESTSSVDKSVLFSWQDYLLFALSLALPLAIGIFVYLGQLLKGRSFSLKRIDGSTGDNDFNGHKSTEQFLLGNRSINFIAVGLSTLASILNGAFIIGFSAEVHYQGIAYTIFNPLGLLLVTPLFTQVIVPKYHDMKFTSAYEYIEHRFNKPSRFLAAGIFITTMMIFLAVVLYVPALVFTHVTGLSFHLTIIISSGMCTLYTAMGGMKTVVYTDCLQMAIIVAGLVALCALGSEVGWLEIWDVALANGRINLNTFSIDPRVRITFWNLVIGGGMTMLCFYMSNQMIVQRFMAVPSAGKAKKVIYVAVASTFLMFGLITFVGLMIHSAYFKCDPIVNGHISSPDQIFVHFMMMTLGKYKGMSGLIVAAIFAAALSSISSAINSLAAVFLEDIIGPTFEHFKKGKLSDRSRKRIAIITVIIFGLLTIGLSFATDKFISKLCQIFPTIWGAMGGPLGGMFLLGFFFPSCNAPGAIIGCLGGLTLTLWIAIGSIIYAPPTPSLPIGACAGNLTLILPLVAANETQVHSPMLELYKISFAWYGFLGAGSTIAIGCLVSVITGGCRTSHKEQLKKHLWFSCADKFCCCCPKICLEALRCGGPNHKDDDGVNEVNNGIERSNSGRVDSGKGSVNYAYNDDNNDVILKQFKRYSPENGQ